MKSRTDSELRDLREAAQYVKVFTRPVGGEDVEPLPHKNGCFSCRHSGVRLAPEKRYTSFFVQAIKDVEVDADGDPQFEIVPAFSILLCWEDKAWEKDNNTLYFMLRGQPGTWPRIWYNYYTWSQLKTESLYVRQYRIGSDKPELHVNSRVNMETLLPKQIRDNPNGWNYHVNAQPNWGPGVYLDLNAQVSTFAGRAHPDQLIIADKEKAIEFTKNNLPAKSKGIQLTPVKPLTELKKRPAFKASQL